MSKIKVNYLHDGAVAQVILDDGKGNVIDQEMMNELIAFFNDCKSQNNLR